VEKAARGIAAAGTILFATFGIAVLVGIFVAIVYVFG
jgi:hypothetical protein